MLFRSKNEKKKNEWVLIATETFRCHHPTTSLQEKIPGSASTFATTSMATFISIPYFSSTIHFFFHFSEFYSVLATKKVNMLTFFKKSFFFLFCNCSFLQLSLKFIDTEQFQRHVWNFLFFLYLVLFGSELE